MTMMAYSFNIPEEKSSHIHVLEGSRIADNPVPERTLNENPFLVLSDTVNHSSFGLSEKKLSYGLMALSSPGGGKTTLFFQILDALLKRKEDDKIVVIDTKGDYLREFSRCLCGKQRIITGLPDGDAWNIFHEIMDYRDGCWHYNPLHDPEAQEIAGQLFAGMKSETQPVFPEMAKLIFSGVTLHMARTAGGRDLKTSDLTGFLKRATGEDLIRVFSHPGMQDYRSCISFIKGNNAQTQGVLSYVVSCVQKVFGTASAGRRQFSIREMYQKPGRTVLFLEYDIAKAISTAPLYGVIADRVIAEALGGRAEKRSNVYLFVDELSALPPIERLSKALSFGRGLNVHVLAGVQNTPAIEAIYGKYGALGLLAGFQNIFTFKLNDNETIQYISDRLGETYEDVSYRNLRQNIHAQRTGKTLAVHDFDVINRTLGLCAVALEGEKPFLFHMPKYQGG